MTKIEEYKAAKRIADSIARDVACTLGRDSPRNDKHHLYVKFSHLIGGDWSPMCFQIEAHYGYYGSSSGYSATSEELGKYLAKAIYDHRSTLLDHAAKLAAEDAEKARKAAEEEAREVLQATTEKQAA
jgi:hypothetical protein